MSDEKISKSINFGADEALMFLIQQTTKLPTEDILGFFYDLGMRVVDIGVDNMSGRGIRKDIRDTFPNTHIPYKLLVKGNKRDNWINSGTATRNMVRDGTSRFNGSMLVTFPDTCRSVDQKALIEKIVEKTLLDGESLPDFPQPINKTPKMYKKLMKEIIQGTKNTCKESSQSQISTED